MRREDRQEIVKGEDATIVVQVLDENEDPVSLAGFTSATIYLSGSVTASGSVVSSDLGKLTFTLTDTQTGNLTADDDADFEVVIVQGSTTTIVQFEKALIIKARIWA